MPAHLHLCASRGSHPHSPPRDSSPGGGTRDSRVFQTSVQGSGGGPPASYSSKPGPPWLPSHEPGSCLHVSSVLANRLVGACTPCCARGAGWVLRQVGERLWEPFLLLCRSRMPLPPLVGESPFPLCFPMVYPLSCGSPSPHLPAPVPPPRGQPPYPDRRCRQPHRSAGSPPRSCTAESSLPARSGARG